MFIVVELVEFIVMALKDDFQVVSVVPLRSGAEVITVLPSDVRFIDTGVSLNMSVPLRLVLSTVWMVELPSTL